MVGYQSSDSRSMLSGFGWVGVGVVGVVVMHSKLSCMSCLSCGGFSACVGKDIERLLSKNISLGDMHDMRDNLVSFRSVGVVWLHDMRDNLPSLRWGLIAKRGAVLPRPAVSCVLPSSSGRIQSRSSSRCIGTNISSTVLKRRELHRMMSRAVNVSNWFLITRLVMVRAVVFAASTPQRSFKALRCVM